MAEKTEKEKNELNTNYKVTAMHTALILLNPIAQRKVVFKLCKGILYLTLALTGQFGTAYILQVVLSAGEIRRMNCSCSSMILPSSENSSH